MESNVVSVLKKGKIVNIPEAELVNGDILLLQAGDLVPADVKLIEVRGLEVDEFDLTGEVMPVEKQLDEKEEVFVYKGSRVTRGNGKGLVVATGEATEYGKILKQQWGQIKYRRPPLVKSKYFILLVFLLPPLIVAINYSSNLALICLTFIVSAILILLVQNSDLFKYLIVKSGIKQLVKNKIELNDETSLTDVCETDVICLDKTGVLTTRDVEVKQIHFADQSPDLAAFVSDEGLLGLTKIACALCNDVIILEKINQADSMDRALISFAVQKGIDINRLYMKYKRTYDKPFDSEDRYMATGFTINNQKIYFAKGDPQVILKMCKKYATISGTEKKIDFAFLTSVKSQTNNIDANGDRTIALAYSNNSQETPPLEYTFLCLVQFENPLKPESLEVVNKLKESGVRLIMITGDRPETALKISNEIGIDNGSNYSLTGRTMERMDFSEIAKQSDHISVYSRLLPSQKGTIVRLLQQRNRFVVMVGDGPNDVVALRVANLGVSFNENSSPFAKRVAKILINDLPDLLTIIYSAKRINQRKKQVMIARIATVTSIYLILYLQTLNLIIHLL